MRAIVQDVYGEAEEVLRVAEIDRPTIGDDEVLVRVHAAGVDRGTWHIMAGLPYPLRLFGYGLRAPADRVRGREVAGRVEKIGSAVSTLNVGDAVFGIAEGTLGVDVTLTFFADCPNWQLADVRLREALDRAGQDDVHVEHRQVTTPEQAEAAGFRGSPTVLIDGRDSDALAGLSCRESAPRPGWPVRPRSSSCSRCCREAARTPTLAERGVGDLWLLRAGPAAHRRARARGHPRRVRVLALRAVDGRPDRPPPGGHTVTAAAAPRGRVRAVAIGGPSWDPCHDCPG